MVSIRATAPPSDNLSHTDPPKLLSRRPTLVRKRDDTDLALGASSGPESPGKRARVTFDNHVEVRTVAPWEELPEIIQEEVRRAIDLYHMGDDTGYNKIQDVFAARSDAEEFLSETTFINYVLALLSYASQLDRSCSSLVHAVLNTNWLGRDENAATVYIRFLGSLVVAQGCYLMDVLRKLVEYLGHTPLSVGRLPDHSVVFRHQIYSRIHTTLAYLVRLAPLASTILSNILVDKFPHSSDSKRNHVSYVNNLLRIIDYAPELQADILALILDRIVKIDVEVQIDLEDLPEELTKSFLGGNSKVRNSKITDPAGESDTDSSDSDSDIDIVNIEAERAREITSNVQKLDLLIDILFSHYDVTFASSSSIEDRIDRLQSLALHFANIILPTYRSRHTQFLLFHFAQTSEVLIDGFVGACTHLAFEKGRSTVQRQSAAAYLASFVSRGAHVPAHIVRDVFDIIGNELYMLRQANEPTCRGPDLRRYGVYYSLVQALLYIFCFRWRDLEASSPILDSNLEYGLTAMDDTTQQHNFVSGIKETLSANVFSRLNPLKVCSPVIVQEFARITNHLGIIYVYHLLETNKRVHLPNYGTSMSSGARETALTNKKDGTGMQLDEYFPFDPYQLPKSKRWLAGDYREWKGIPGLDKVDDSSSDSEESESGDSESDSDDDDDDVEEEEDEDDEGVDKISVSS